MKTGKNIVFVFLMAVMLMLSACGQEDAQKQEAAPAEFVGEWQCSEHPLEQEDYYTGFLMLKIREDGTFRMTDVEAGNPAISGTMQVVSDSELILKCSTEDDFDPPPTWTSMKEEQNIRYEFISDQELHLIYEGEEGTSTLIFTLEE